MTVKMSDEEFWNLYRKVERWIFENEKPEMVRDVVEYYEWVASKTGKPVAEALFRKGLISGTLYDEIKDVERIVQNIGDYDLSFIKAQLIRILEVLEQAYFSNR